jgi:RNA polymerase sigma factor (sigma-70 family)
MQGIQAIEMGNLPMCRKRRPSIPEHSKTAIDLSGNQAQPHLMEEVKATGCQDGCTDETALIARTLQGDRSAFDVLFKRYQDYVYRIVYGIVGNSEEAKDLTQDVFLQAFRSLGQFRGQAKFATWLYRIAVNRATDAVRTAQRKRFLPLWDWMVSGDSDVADCREFPEIETTRGQVQEALLRCPLVLRQALVLRYYNECNLEEMSEILNCSIDAVKVRLHRARAAFRQAYETVCREEESAPEVRSEE